MQEIWKPIKEFEGIFEISNLGRVKSLARVVPNHTGVIHKSEKILKLRLNHKGYSVVSIGKKKCALVHRLVALAFIPNPLNKPQVNHIDGNKQNNCVDNLEWCTNSENQIHAYKHGLNHHSEKSGRPKKPILQIDVKTNAIVAEYPSIADAIRKITPNAITNNIGACCRGKYKTCHGYKWRYKNE